MANETKNVPKDPEQDLETKALEWALGLDAVGVCPVCSHTSSIGNEQEKRNATRTHIRERHLSRVLLGYVNGKNIDAINEIHKSQTAELDAMSPTALGLDGVDVVDDHMRFNLFELPKEVEHRVISDGGRIHFASPKRVGHYRDRGFEILPGKAADGTTKVNEMVALRVPNKVWSRRAESKSNLIDNSLPARKEDMSRNMDEIGRRAYDAAQRRGKTSDQAMNIARAVERGIASGKITVRDQRGSREI